jgi:hypothetical protein
MNGGYSKNTLSATSDAHVSRNTKSLKQSLSATSSVMNMNGGGNEFSLTSSDMNVGNVFFSNFFCS